MGGHRGQRKLNRKSVHTDVQEDINVTVEDIRTGMNKMAKLKAVGPDLVQGCQFKKLTGASITWNFLQMENLCDKQQIYLLQIPQEYRRYYAKYNTEITDKQYVYQPFAVEENDVRITCDMTIYTDKTGYCSSAEWYREVSIN